MVVAAFLEKDLFFNGLLGEWLGNHKDRGLGVIGLALLAFAVLCGFLAYKGLGSYRKHPRVRQSNPR
jgi:hypothetical protein